MYLLLLHQISTVRSTYFKYFLLLSGKYRQLNNFVFGILTCCTWLHHHHRLMRVFGFDQDHNVLGHWAILVKLHLQKTTVRRGCCPDLVGGEVTSAMPSTLAMFNSNEYTEGVSVRRT